MRKLAAVHAVGNARNQAVAPQSSQSSLVLPPNHSLLQRQKSLLAHLRVPQAASVESSCIGARKERHKGSYKHNAGAEFI
jgi:hypothetical protein